MQILDAVTNDSWAKYQKVYVSEDDINNLLEEYSVLIEDIGFKNMENKYLDLWHLLNREKKITQTYALNSLLKKICSKLEKQVEHFVWPIIDRKWWTWHVVLDHKIYNTWNDNNDIKSIRIDYDSSEKEKYDYIKTYNSFGHNQEELKRIWEKFSISITNLKKVLKERWNTEEQMEKKLDVILHKEETTQVKVIHDLYQNYDHSLRTEIFFDEFEWQTQYDVRLLDFDKVLRYAYIINNALYPYEWKFNKVDKLLKDAYIDDRGISRELQYIKIGLETVNKNTTSWLFEDKYWNPLLVHELIMNEFQLSEDEVKEFINSRTTKWLGYPRYLAKSVKYKLKYPFREYR